MSQLAVKHEVSEPDWDVKTTETIQARQDVYVELHSHCLPLDGRISEKTLRDINKVVRLTPQFDSRAWQQVTDLMQRELGVSLQLGLRMGPNLRVSETRHERMTEMWREIRRTVRHPKMLKVRRELERTEQATERRIFTDIIRDYVGRVQSPLAEDILEQRILEYPLAVMGSPPTSWRDLKTMAFGSSATLVAVGSTVEHRPVLCAIYMGTVALLYMTKPSAKVVRRGIAQKIAKAMETDFKEADEG